MWLAHSRKTDFTVTVVGSGASIVTDNPTDLFNGRPADATRLQWLDAATPAITDYVDIQIERATPFSCGFAGLVGLDVLAAASSAGIKMAFTGKRSGDPDFSYSLGGNTALQRTMQRSDGSVAALTIPNAGLDDLIGLQLRIWNDQNGAVVFGPGDYVDLGDLIGSLGFDLDIDAKWKLTPPRNSYPVSRNEQPWPFPYPPGRTFTASRSQIPFDEAYIDGANPCWQSLLTICGNGDVSVMIPRYGAQGALDVDKLHATAIFGLASFSEIDRAEGDIFSVNFSSQEIPALLA